ncbi:MAG: BatA domain-containing protein [Anaerolineae bacterium]|nr:BatA domain-containing protein [Gemmatimonadaceae bacterium]
MTFLAPWFLLAAVAASAGVVALHFFARQRPRAAILPTARFVPDLPARSRGRSNRPADLLLLAMRVMGVLLAGLAFAQPIREPSRRPLARVVAIDISRAARPDSAFARQLRTLFRQGDVLVVFDSAARVVRGSVLDSVRTLVRSTARGSLSAGLIASLRARDSLSRDADSVELVLVSPLAIEEWDAATASIRALWPGPIGLERMPAMVDTTKGRLAIDFRGDDADPLRATVALLGAASVASDSGAVRLVRGIPTAADSGWARQADRVLLAWPVEASEVSQRVAKGTTEGGRLESDTVGGVIAGDAMLVAQFSRSASPSSGRVIARWVDGEPAATEVALGAGCLRSVAVPVENRGDFALRKSTRDFVAELSAPCGGRRHYTPLPDWAISLLAGGGPARKTATLRRDRDRRSPATPWLLGGALLTAALEPLVRRTRAT